MKKSFPEDFMLGKVGQNLRGITSLIGNSERNARFKEKREKRANEQRE